VYHVFAKKNGRARAHMATSKLTFSRRQNQGPGQYGARKLRANLNDAVLRENPTPKKVAKCRTPGVGPGLPREENQVGRGKDQKERTLWPV